MPSNAILEKKKQQVEALSEKMKNSCAGVLVDYKGISVEEDTKLRKELREAGVEYTVVKNTLLGMAAEKAGHGKKCTNGNSRKEIYAAGRGFLQADEAGNARV